MVFTKHRDDTAGEPQMAEVAERVCASEWSFRILDRLSFRASEFASLG